MKRIIVVGMGNVGFTYTTIAVARGLQAEYVFVDLNQDVIEAHVHDFQDMVALMPRNGSTFRAGTLKDDAKGADLIIITASISVPADQMHDRLRLLQPNAPLMKKFASDAVDNGFKGTFIVAANPCDVMAACIHYSTGYNFRKVISTGTLLDSARLQKFIAQKLNVEADSVKASILAEHGKSCMAAWSTAKVGDTPLDKFARSKKITPADYDDLLDRTIKEGGYIYSRKGNTQFGIGTSLFEISKAVLNNERRIMNVGVKLPSNYKNAGIYSSIPVIVGENGYEYLPTKPSLNKEELAKFEASTSSLAENHKMAMDILGIDKDFN